MYNKHKGGYQLVSFYGYHGVYCRRDRERDKTLTIIVKDFSMFQICFWYNRGHDDQNKVENVAIRCIDSVKQTDVSMYDMNTKHKDITTSFVSNTVLHHVGMSYIIE